jgi:hypothetical protein
VATCGRENLAAIRAACVPLPAPGAPNSTRRMDAGTAGAGAGSGAALAGAARMRSTTSSMVPMAETLNSSPASA